MKMVTFKNDIRLIQKYDGKTIQGMTMVDQESYGLSKLSNWYGGNMKKTSIIKDKGIFLALAEDMKTLGVGYFNENSLDNEDRGIFGLELRKNIISEENSIDNDEVILTPSNETVKIVSNKINIPQKNNKRR